MDESVMLRNNVFRQRAGVPRGRVFGANGVLALQRSAGNRVTRELLFRSCMPGSTVQRDDKDAPTVASPRRGGALLPGKLWLANPEELWRNKPSLAPKGGLPELPPSQVVGLINWGDIGTAYRERRLVLEDRDRAVIVGHWQLWYPVAQALHKLPVASSLFKTPAAIMNTMSAKMIDSSLAGDHLDIIERFNLEAEQFGVKTSTVSFTLKRF
ncbi:MAG: hypothetical protein LC799_20045 [Actinobacteria bacterium]|nr:hypothetical protein [Actinomycetota bacterium]